ncbi:hypothetical protein [Pseudonocardia sp. ICBG601]|uniref:hypothetical protein n=1 Tax=Pseudonocardia sp. ICBG601 TaxID=2846759 RepID=UPI001CF6ED20|nr:hypothetical protein [Pseudonocardia sp. ICBG601]
MSMKKCAHRTAIVAIAVTVAVSASTGAAPVNHPALHAASAIQQVSQHATTDPAPFTEEQIAALRSSAEAIVRDARSNGTITPQEEERLRDYLVDGRTNSRVLPVWAVGALAGCAISVLNGPVKSQAKELLKTGKVDEASNIAVDAAVDCVFGAIPGGAITSAVKKTLTTPIKNALKPHVKTVLQKIKGSGPAAPKHA